MIYTITAPIMSPCAILLQHLFRLYNLSMIYNVTAPTTSLRPLYYSNYKSLCSILLQQLLHPNDLYYHSNLQPLVRPYALNCHSNSFIPMINIVTAIITFLCSILLQQLLRLYALYCHSNYYVPMLYLDTTTDTSLCPLLLQQPLRLYALYYSNSYVLCSILVQQLLRPYTLYC